MPLTALNNDDYIEGPGKFVISTDTLSDEIVYQIPANDIVEDDESFSISLTASSLPTLKRSTSPVEFGPADSVTTKVVINDDDTGIAIILTENNSHSVCVFCFSENAK